MGKLASLQLLESYGLNTPELLLTLPQFMQGAEKLDQWRKWLHTTKIDQRGLDFKISIRTERDGETRTPHYPNRKLEEITPLIKELGRDGYAIHLFRGIDPKDAEIRGNLVYITKEDKVIFEFLEGGGTVRSLEFGTPKTLILRSRDRVPDRYLAIAQAYGTRFSNQILEWSIYKYPVGKLNQKEIYWELRPWR